MTDFIYQYNYVAIARDLVLKYIDTTQFKVFLFGSRACGNARFNSDIDIGVWGSNRLSIQQKNAIEEALEESIIPFKVDIVDFTLADENFKKYALRKIVEWS